MRFHYSQQFDWVQQDPLMSWTQSPGATWYTHHSQGLNTEGWPSRDIRQGELITPSLPPAMELWQSVSAQILSDYVRMRIESAGRSGYEARGWPHAHRHGHGHHHMRYRPQNGAHGQLEFPSCYEQERPPAVPPRRSVSADGYPQPYFEFQQGLSETPFPLPRAVPQPNRYDDGYGWAQAQHPGQMESPVSQPHNYGWPQTQHPWQADGPVSQQQQQQHVDIPPPPRVQDAPANVSSTAGSDRAYDLPPRQPGAQMTGSQFLTEVLHADPANPQVKGITGPARERAILAQIEAGNIPDFLRQPKTVRVEDKKGNVAEIEVMPDYMAIGTNEDYVRVPMTPTLAKTIADQYGLQLPTKKLVGDIYNSADVKLSAVGLVRDANDTNYMDGNGFYLKHNRIIQSQLGRVQPGMLVAGEKKDLIISHFAETHPTKLDYFGFFDRNGHAIQGAHGGPHNINYVDYSHGARFISQDVVVNGQHRRYDDVLRDPQFAGLLSDEGAFDPSHIYATRRAG
jgi:hypothetical protein